MYYVNGQEQGTTNLNIINKGDEWSYHDDTYLNSKDWINQQFLPASDWKTGNAPLGYNVDDLATVIGFGQDSTQKVLTSYYHKTFFVENTSDFYAYKLNIRRDDGAIIYINGKEVWRTNMPNFNKISNKTKAVEVIKGSKEDKFYTKVLFPNNFLSGINIIAVEIHQRGKSTSDSVFQNIELKQEIKDLNYRIEIERYGKKLSSLKTRKTIIDIILIISLIALVISIFYIIRLIKEKINANTKVRDLKESTLLKEKELLNLSLRNIQSKQQLELVDEDLSN